MAADWIKVEATLPDKPEVIQMATILDIDQDSVAGKLLRVWIWADANSVDGNAVSVTNTFLDRLANRAGFADAMRKVGWLEGRDGSLSFPRFDRHNGQSAKARAAANRRAQGFRDRQKGVCEHNESVTVTPLRKALPEKRREDIIPPLSSRTRETIIASGKSQGVPEDACEAFLNDMEAVGWIDRAGRPIASVPAALAKFWRHWQSNEAERRQKGRQSEAERDQARTGMASKINVPRL